MLALKQQFPYRQSWASAGQVYFTQSVLKALRYFGHDNPHGLISLIKPKPKPFQQYKPSPFPYPSPAPVPGPGPGPGPVSASPASPISTSINSFGYAPRSPVNPVNPPPQKSHKTRANPVKAGRIAKKNPSNQGKIGNRQVWTGKTKEYWRKRGRGKTGKFYDNARPNLA